MMKVVVAATESDDGPDAVAPQKLRAEIDGRLHAHAVEHQPLLWSIVLLVD